MRREKRERRRERTEKLLLTSRAKNFQAELYSMLVHSLSHRRRRCSQPAAGLRLRTEWVLKSANYSMCMKALALTCLTFSLAMRRSRVLTYSKNVFEEWYEGEKNE
jgi:hypothetical protein